MNDGYCECGSLWTKVFNTMLIQDCYYCHACDKVFEPTVKEITKEMFKESFMCDRFSEVKRYAQIVKAKKNVTPDDLVALGYLEAKK